MKLTGWFSENTKPVHIGVYRTRHYLYDNKYASGYSYWNGEKWSNCMSSVKDAYSRFKWTERAIQEKEWHGLAEQPK